MAKKKNKDSGGLKGDEWLGTYADCVTLLLTFFVLLYSMSSVDSQKVQAISEAFSVMTGQNADSILEFEEFQGSQPVLGGESETDDDTEAYAQNNLSMYSEVKEYIEENNLDTTIEVKQDEQGVVLHLTDSILFRSGSADLISTSYPVLDTINELLLTMPNSVVIEGHTDNDPISNSRYADNWDLSTQRATTVLRYFLSKGNEDPSRFSAAGYGEFRPNADNTSDENKAQNRRVNILIVANNKE